MIKEYDIICFLETKLDNHDVLNVPNGYDYVMKNRKKVKRKSGGIVVVYKKLLSNHISFLTSNSEFVQWLEISSDLTGLPKKWLLGCIYIPPENSKYSSDSAFDEIETEFISLSSDNANYISLFGDFNARTATVPDFVIPNDELFENLGFLDEFDDETLRKLYSYKLLIDNDIPIERCSQDIGRSNNYGQTLIDMCKRCSLYVANGRLCDDKNIGKTTCKNVSIVDYLLLSSDLFTFVNDFCVLDYDPMFSDVHNRIHFTFSFQVEKQVNPQNDNINSFVKWKVEKTDQFQRAISHHLGEIDTKLDDLIQSENISNDQVNTTVCELANAFLSTATDVMGTVKQFDRKGKHSDSKPWFDAACREKRDAYHKVKKTVQ